MYSTVHKIFRDRAPRLISFHLERQWFDDARSQGTIMP